MFSSLSTMSLVLFGVIALVAVVVIWKWWKKPVDTSQSQSIEEATKSLLSIQPVHSEQSEQSGQSGQSVPIVFAVNDEGNLDLTDMSGKILNIGYGPNPKTYIGLLDTAEKDTEKIESESGIMFKSTVGDTKQYEIAGRPYIINYTHL